MNNSQEEQSTTFCCPNGFTLFGQTLVPGFLLPHQINFGTLLQDSSRDTTVKIINYSDSAVSIFSFALNDPDSGFAFVDTNVRTIPAEDSERITIRFAPKQVKSYSGEITILTDEACTNTYIVSLAGLVAPSSVSTGETSLHTLNVIPSVADGYINIVLPSASGSLAVCNILGQQIYSNVTTVKLNGNNLSIDTRSWPDGTYFATYSSKDAAIASKFILRH